MEKIEVVDHTVQMTLSEFIQEMYREMRGICTLCDQDVEHDGHDRLCPCAENKDRADA